MESVYLEWEREYCRLDTVETIHSTKREELEEEIAEEGKAEIHLY